MPALTDAAAGEVAPPADEAALEEQPATSDTPQVAPLVVTGYVDVGFAKAQGDGTSFHPADSRAPLDYGVDPFAPAVNSRGEAASTIREPISAATRASSTGSCRARPASAARLRSC